MYNNGRDNTTSTTGIQIERRTAKAIAIAFGIMLCCFALVLAIIYRKRILIFVQKQIAVLKLSAQQEKLKIKAHTWHECENTYSAQLVPQDIHNSVSHSGGVAVVNNMDIIQQKLRIKAEYDYLVSRGRKVTLIFNNEEVEV